MVKSHPDFKTKEVRMVPVYGEWQTEPYRRPSAKVETKMRVITIIYNH